MKNKNKIFWITTVFPKGKESKKGIFIYRTVMELSKYYPITVICLCPIMLPIFSMFKNPKNFSGIFREWRKLNPSKPFNPNSSDKIDVIYVKYFRPSRGRLSFLEGYFAFLAVKNKIKNLRGIKNNLLHANWIFPEGKVAELLWKKFRIPYIVTLRGDDISNIDSNFLNRKSASSILKESNKVTSVTSSLIEKCRSKNLIVDRKKEAVTHNFYEVTKFIIKEKRKARERLNLKINSKILFFAGELIKRKNVDILIKGIKQLYMEGYDLRLYIAGSGYEENSLKNLASENNITSQVFFVGNLNSEKLIEYYNAADLFCLISKSEGLPNVVVESLLCGTPVIGSAVDGIPSLITEGVNGFLVEPDSVPSFCEKVKIGLDTAWNRTKIRESMSFLFPENVIKEYHQLYKEFNIQPLTLLQ